jgi:putative hydrolase
MKVIADYHTHTKYSDGKGTVLENVLAAKERGLSEVAITDHSFNHWMFNLHRKEIGQFIADCREAEKQTGVHVLVGIEDDILNYKGKIGTKPKEEEKFDIIIAGFHPAGRVCLFLDLRFLFARIFPFVRKSKRFIKKNTKIIAATLRRNNIDILVHPGKSLPVDIYQVAKVCAETNTYLEINEKTPTLNREDVLALLSTGVKFVMNSDAHCSANVANYTRMGKEMEGMEEHITNCNETIKLKDHKKAGADK